MPRKVRIDAPGALHHIIVLGTEVRRIFGDDADRDSFVARLGRVLAETNTACLGWALILKHLKNKQKALQRTLGTLENAIAGPNESVRKEPENAVGRSFDTTNGPIAKEAMDVVEHYPVDANSRKTCRTIGRSCANCIAFAWSSGKACQGTPSKKSTYG